MDRHTEIAAVAAVAADAAALLLNSLRRGERERGVNFEPAAGSTLSPQGKTPYLMPATSFTSRSGLARRHLLPIV